MWSSTMRDYYEHEFEMQMAYGRLTPLVRTFRNWRKRRMQNRINCFSDAELKQIGLSRNDRLL